MELYASWFDADPAYFKFAKGNNKQALTHVRNAANLARKALYDRIQVITTASPRIDHALSYFFGMEQKKFQDPLQQPSFFYIPDLTAKAFYSVDEIPGLAEFIKRLSEYKSDLLGLAHNSYQYYIDTSGQVPDTEAWRHIKPKWLSTHLLRGDEKIETNEIRLQQCQNLLDDPIIAHCAPHAAEAFVSSLLVGAEIPPHYGLSNLKLTVHMPLQVNNGAVLHAGVEQRYWSEGISALIFDDSFLHSAANHGKERRDVFIFDIWHPELTEHEKNALRFFMNQHQLWAEKYAKLASLDARF